jgi:DNA (cytosine-5)-methyltransferase 1
MEVTSVEEVKTLWFTKSRRAKDVDDYETWIEGGVMPTMNAFDNGDVRTTIIIFHPHYHDGARVQGDTMNTLTSRMGTGGNNVSMVATIPIQGTIIGRSDTAGPQGKGYGEDGDPMYTLDSVSGHGVATIFSHTQGLDAQPSEEVSPTLRAGGAGMAVAYDEFNDSVSDTHHTLRSGTKQSTGVINKSTVRRLTPVECERLQGFPDDWTVGQSDSSRYKQMGNAVAVPVVEWLIGNICDIV